VSTTPAATQRPASVFDQAAYWLTVVGVYFLVGVLFFYSGKSKLFDQDGHAPPALKKQFQGTFIDKVPGVDAAWVILGVLELAIAAIMVLSIVRGEFLPRRTKALLLVALALFDFACLSFGQTSIGNTEGTASLYVYFASTAVIFLLVLRLPPNGPPAWLGARAPGRD
jgi:uncharacterized membrane protein YphA (DoxX/SURF4 family)